MVPADLESLKVTVRGLLPMLQDRFGVARIWIVGSRARGDHRQDSDLDLLVEFERRDFSLYEFVELEFELSDRLGLAVDLAEPSALRPRVREQVEKDAVPI